MTPQHKKTSKPSPTPSKGQNGKGDKPRPVNATKFSKNWENINWKKHAEIPNELLIRNRKWQIAVGKCPHCHEYPTWFNDVPLTAFCWGSSTKEHREWSRVIPGKAQPYQ